jgi:hypothetical protein
MNSDFDKSLFSNRLNEHSAAIPDDILAQALSLVNKCVQSGVNSKCWTVVHDYLIERQKINPKIQKDQLMYRVKMYALRMNEPVSNFNKNSN